MKQFTMPETVKYRAAYGTVKTRKVEGGFEAVAALYFMGKRVGLQYSTAATRARASGAAMRALGL